MQGDSVPCRDDGPQPPERSRYCQLGASSEVALSVPIEEGGAEHEGTPAAAYDYSAVSAQRDDKKGKVNDVKESIEPPPYTFEDIFVPDFMNEESLTQLPKIPLSPIVKLERDAAPRFESGSFCVPDVRKSEPLLVTISGQCNETTKPCQETSITHIELTPRPKASSTESESATRKTRGRDKTNLNILADSLHKNRRYHEPLRPSGHQIHENRYITGGQETRARAWRTVWLSPASPWRHLAAVKAAKRRMHRWTQKR